MALDQLANKHAEESAARMNLADAEAVRSQYAFASGNFNGYMQGEFDNAKQRLADEYDYLTANATGGDERAYSGGGAG